jgi:cyclophilin family peptidyl-prolyl cis-trans isomerase
MARIYSHIEPLEARIAPAAVPLLHPLPDIIAGIGKTGATVDLGNAFDADGSYRTVVEFTTNFDMDATAAGLQAGVIRIELFDDTTPLTVQNFLAYVNEVNTKGDYTNTFFHRLVDDFVLQGGGFNTETFTHIPTKPTVHNEFNSAYPGYGTSTTDDLRVNVRGTVAMAKVGAEAGGGPNTASSEWFVNLGDNSANLDVQNGGFTVFGRVTDASMAVVDAIAARPTADIRAATASGALSDVPYNPGYNPNPDNNASTPAPKPTADQLIRITGVNVIAPNQGEAPAGTTFSFALSNVEGNLTSFVTPTLNGDTLSFAYKPGASGVAKVTVTANNGGDTTTDEFLLTVKPNLIAEAGGDTLPGVLVPSDTGTAKVKISNNTAGLAKGKVDVKFYLSQETATDPHGLTLDASDIEIGSLTGLSLNLASGKSATFTGKVAVPKEIVDSTGTYRVIAQVTPQGSSISEVFTDDNTMIGGAEHGLFNAFGNLPLGTDKNGNPVVRNATLTYTDAGGHLVSLSLKGGGVGVLGISANGIDIIARDVNGASALSVKTQPGLRTTLHSVVVEQPSDNVAARVAMGTLALGSVDLTGDISALGGLKSLTVGNLTPLTANDSGVIEIGPFSEAPGQKATINLGVVRDYFLNSESPIAALNVANWLDTNANAEFVQSRFLDSVTSKGNFEADLYVLSGGLLKTMNVAGSLKGSAVFVAGNVGNVTLGGMENSKFLVGVNQATVPANLAALKLQDFTASRSIASFIVKGTSGLEFKNSDVAAARIGSINIQAPITEGGATDTFGIIADRITRYQRGNVIGTNIDAGDPDGDGDADTTVYDPVGANYKLILL